MRALVIGGWMMAALLAPACAVAADIGPQSSSDQVRAARPLGPVDALGLVVKRTTAGPAPGPAEQTLAVTLSQSFTYVIDGQTRQVEDNTLCHTFIWRDGADGLTSLNCYALPNFKGNELANRQALNAMVRRAKPDAAEPSDDYWAEAELGFSKNAPNRLKVSTADGVTEYRLGDRLVARVTPSREVVSEEERHEFIRFLALHEPIHPQIRADLAAAKTLPAQITLTTLSVGGAETQTTLTFSAFKRAKAAYPLPAGLTAQIRLDGRRGANPRDKAFAQIVSVLDGKAPPKPTREALLQGMEKATDPVDAIFLFINLAQQYGGDFKGPDGPVIQARTGPVLRRIGSDPTVQRILEVNRMSGDGAAPGDREAAAKFLATELKTDGRPFGTFRYVTYGNLALMSKDSGKWSAAAREGMPKNIADDFWLHIAAYPWASNAYRDLATVYLTAYQTPDAWEVIDLGRAVDPDWRRGILGQIEPLEQALRRDMPECF